MTGSRAIPLIVALLCISSIGVAATTLESSLSTDPDDEINPDWDRLPIGQGDAATIQQEMRQGGGVEGGESDDDAESDSDDDSEPDDDADADPDDADDEGTAGATDHRDRDDGSGFERGTGDPPLFDRLVALLAAILRVLVGVAVLFGVVALAHHYREGLLEVVDTSSGDRPLPEEQPSPDDGFEWPPTAPASVVDRAWLRLVDDVGLERPEIRTPRECAARALEAGVDVEAVEAITDAFERVHYGGRPIADEEPRARAGLERLRGGDG